MSGNKYGAFPAFFCFRKKGGTTSEDSSSFHAIFLIARRDGDFLFYVNRSLNLRRENELHNLPMLRYQS